MDLPIRKAPPRWITPTSAITPISLEGSCLRIRTRPALGRAIRGIGIAMPTLVATPQIELILLDWTILTTMVTTTPTEGAAVEGGAMVPEEMVAAAARAGQV